MPLRLRRGACAELWEGPEAGPGQPQTDPPVWPPAALPGPAPGPRGWQYPQPVQQLGQLSLLAPDRFPPPISLPFLFAPTPGPLQICSTPSSLPCFLSPPSSVPDPPRVWDSPHLRLHLPPVLPPPQPSAAPSLFPQQPINGLSTVLYSPFSLHDKPLT